MQKDAIENVLNEVNEELQKQDVQTIKTLIHRFRQNLGTRQAQLAKSQAQYDDLMKEIKGAGSLSNVMGVVSKWTNISAL